MISRREQLAAYHDERGVEIAKTVRHRETTESDQPRPLFRQIPQETCAQKYAELVERLTKIEGLIDELQGVEMQGTDAPPIDGTRGALLNLEGRAGALYWECVQRLLPAGRFTNREHQGAVDDVNALLNYGYGILYSQVWSALSLAGLNRLQGSCTAV